MPPGRLSTAVFLDFVLPMILVEIHVNCEICGRGFDAGSRSLQTLTAPWYNQRSSDYWLPKRSEPMPVEQIGLDPAADLSNGKAAGAQLLRKFNRLRDSWKAQRGHESSTMKSVLLPAYQNIIGIGPAAIPLLLRELETNLDNWFWALMAITEEDPVPESIRGDGEAMAQAWLNWGKERGYQW